MGQNKSKERKFKQETVNDDDKTDKTTALCQRIENQSEQTLTSAYSNKLHHPLPTKQHETGITPQCITELVDNQKNKCQSQVGIQPYYDDVIGITELDKTVLDHLISKCVILIEDREEVAKLATQFERNKAILDILMERPYNTSNLFKDVLLQSNPNNSDVLEFAKKMHLTESNDNPIDLQPRPINIGEHIIKLQKNYMLLVHNIDCTTNISDHLLQEGVLENEDREEICAPGITIHESNRRLLAKFLWKGRNAYNIFLEALRNDKVYSEYANGTDNTPVTDQDLKKYQIGINQLKKRQKAKEIRFTGKYEQKNSGNQSDDGIDSDEADCDIEVPTISQHNRATQIRINNLNHNKSNTTELHDRYDLHLTNQLSLYKKETNDHECDAYKLEISEWREKDKNYFETQVMNHMITAIETTSCVIAVGEPGLGKSAAIHHIALILEKEHNYRILSCKSSSDIEKFRSHQKQVFVFDDICGKYSVFQNEVESFVKRKDDFRRILKESDTKILISSRLQIFQDPQFKRLNFLTKSTFNLSTDYKSSSEEMIQIAKKYLDEDTLTEIKKDLDSFEFFPLKCALYKLKERDPTKNILHFFQDPFDVYRKELDSYSEQLDKSKFCALFICVLQNGFIDESVLSIGSKFEQTIKRICRICGTDPKNLQKTLDILDNTYIKKTGSGYKVVHDKMFDFLCFYFGSKYQRELIEFSSTRVIRERTQLVSLKEKCSEFKILIEEKFEHSYFSRLTSDLLHGKVHDVFNNSQMVFENFQQKFVSFIRQKSKEEKTVLLQSSEITCFDERSLEPDTPLSIAFLRGYNKLALFIMSFISNVNEGNFKPLRAACENGEYDFVKRLIKMGADVKFVDKENVSAVKVAYVGGYEKIMKLLINSGVDIDEAVDEGQSLLHLACKDGKYSITKLLLQEGAMIDKKDPKKRTPLRIASENGHENIVKLLVDNKAEVNIEDDEGWTPLMSACRDKKINILNYLIDNQADINHASKKGLTPLIVACFKTQSETLSALINKGVKINEVDSCGRSALLYACLDDNVDIVKKLIDSKAQINLSDKSGKTPLKSAALSGNDIIVDLLLKSGADVNAFDEDGWTCLMSACQSNSEKVIRMLVSDGSDVNHQSNEGNTPILLASEFCARTVVEFFVEKGASINSENNNGWTSLMKACIKNKPDIVNFLLQKGAKVNQQDTNGWSPIKLACVTGNIEIVESCINSGADINMIDNEGWSPLKTASGYGRADIVTHLISKQANIDKPDNTGWTALKLASRKGHTAVVKVLLSSHANVNYEDEDGWTPLMSACRHGHFDIVELLLETGADIDKMSKSGYSALLIACHLENIEIVDLLIQHQADINKSDLKGCSPLHQACNQEHGEIAHMLIQAEADVNISDNEGNTPIMTICEMGNAQFLQTVVAAGADINWTNNNGYTPLLVAHDNGHYAIKTFLISKGADVNKSSIFNSCEKGYLPIIKLLIKDGVNLNSTDSTGLTPLMIAFKHLHFAVVDLLLENGADSNIFPEMWKTIVNGTKIDGVPYFSIACRQGHEQMVKIFMQHGAELQILDLIGDSPIIYALEGAHENIAILLLEHLKGLEYETKNKILSMALARGFETLATILTETSVKINDFDCNGFNQLILGCQKGDELLVDRLLSLEAVAHEVMSTSLKMASTNGHWKIVESLLQHADIVDTDSILPISVPISDIMNIACENGYEHITKLLLTATCTKQYDFNRIHTGNRGWTNLMFACKNGHFEIVAILMNNGADSSVLNDESESAFNIANMYGYTKIVEYFLENGSNINGIDKHGLTPLISACKMNHFLLAQLFISRNANCDQESESGMTPIGTAWSSKSYGIVDLLLQNRVNISEKDLKVFVRDTENGSSNFFQMACKEGYKSVPKMLQIINFDLSKADDSGWTLLMYACQGGHREIVQYLINAKANINQSGRDGLSPLIVACKNELVEIVKLLVANGANCYQVDDTGKTPLFYACQEGKASIVQYLINYKNAIEHPDTNGLTPLIASIKGDYPAILVALIGGGANINNNESHGWTPLRIACDKENKSMIEKLLQLGADIDKADSDGWTPLKSACKNNFKEVVDTLLLYKADVDKADSDGWSPLMSACHKGNIEIAFNLLNNNACIDNKNENGRTALGVACYNGQSEIVSILIDNAADVNVVDEYGNTPIKIASAGARKNSEIKLNKEYKRIVEILIQNSADINKSDNDGWTPLMTACASRNIDIVELLIENKANINCRGKTEWSPLSLACLREQYSIASALLRNGADPTVADNDGWTALKYACLQGHRSIFDLIIEKSRELINSPDNDGWTPLMSACRGGHVKIAESLIQMGAILNWFSNDGQTPYQVGKRNSTIINLLLENGYEIDEFDRLSQIDSDDDNSDGNESDKDDNDDPIVQLLG